MKILHFNYTPGKAIGQIDFDAIGYYFSLGDSLYRYTGTADFLGQHLEFIRPTITKTQGFIADDAGMPNHWEKKNFECSVSRREIIDRIGIDWLFSPAPEELNERDIHKSAAVVINSLCNIIGNCSEGIIAEPISLERDLETIFTCIDESLERPDKDKVNIIGRNIRECFEGYNYKNGCPSFNVEIAELNAILPQKPTNHFCLHFRDSAWGDLLESATPPGGFIPDGDFSDETSILRTFTAPGEIEAYMQAHRHFSDRLGCYTAHKFLDSQTPKR